MTLSSNIATFLNILSAISAFAVLFIFFAIRCYNKDIVDRVTIRLQTGIAIVDLVKHIQGSADITGSDSLYCAAAGFSLYFFYQIYMLLNISIALNLHLVIILGLKPKYTWEICYWCLSLGTPAILNIPLLRIFGKDASGFCAFKNGPKINDFLEIVYTSGICLVTITYCAFISFSVILKMKKHKYFLQPLNKSSSSDVTHKPFSAISLYNLVVRTCLYPIACFVCYFFNNVWVIYYYAFKDVPEWIKITATLCYSSRGFLHMLAFLADPMVNKVLLGIFKSSSSEVLSSENESAFNKTFPDDITTFGHFISQLSKPSSPEEETRKMVGFQRFV